MELISVKNAKNIANKNISTKMSFIYKRIHLKSREKISIIYEKDLPTAR